MKSKDIVLFDLNKENEAMESGGINTYSKKFHPNCAIIIHSVTGVVLLDNRHDRIIGTYHITEVNNNVVKSSINITDENILKIGRDLEYSIYGEYVRIENSLVKSILIKGVSAHV